MTRAIPAETAERLKVLLKPIAEIFRASRITIIVRTPEGSNATGDLVLSNDNPTLVMETLRAHMVAEAARFAAEAERSRAPGAEFPKHKNLDEI